jgi:hypothetical protein
MLSERVTLLLGAFHTRTAEVMVNVTYSSFKNECNVDYRSLICLDRPLRTGLQRCTDLDFVRDCNSVTGVWQYFTISSTSAWTKRS